MRTLIIPALLLPLLWACGPKAPPASSGDPGETSEPVAEAPAAEPEPEPEPEPAPEPEVVAPVYNAALNLTIKHADGSSQSGKVVRIERSVDTHGETEWSLEESDLKFYVEGDEYKKITWNDVKSVNVKVEKEEFDCLYLSDFTPWMYECSIKIVSKITTKDGKKYVADSSKKWRFTFSDDTSAEFWMKRHYARAQDDRTIGIDDTVTQNSDLYKQLQDQLRSDLGTLTQSITIQ